MIVLLTPIPMSNGYIAHIEEQTLSNEAYRRVLFTAPNLQLVVMAIPPSVEIGMETHEDGDQFIRVEAGEATVTLGDTSTVLREDDIVIIPAGTAHNVVNTSATETLKLYSIYTPPEHPDGTLQETKPAEDHH